MTRPAPRRQKAAPAKRRAAVEGPEPAAPLVELTTAHAFSAAHYLRSPHLSPDENLALFGLCAREHGHTYRLEVTVRGPADPRTGMVIDAFRLRRLVEKRIVAALDHRHLDRDVPFLVGQITTLENMCQAIWRQLERPLRVGHGARLHRVTLAEGDSAKVSVTAD